MLIQIPLALLHIDLTLAVSQFYRLSLFLLKLVLPFINYIHCMVSVTCVD